MDYVNSMLGINVTHSSEWLTIKAMHISFQRHRVDFFQNFMRPTESLSINTTQFANETPECKETEK